jgi:RNA polymerase sigma factor (sigma-70 family)
MPSVQPDAVLQQVRKLVGAPGPDLTDGQLLELFAGRREEAAFEALVRRHGPLVLAACRRLLGDPNDADDAFQATFLALARRAPALDRRGSVAAWLYTVAYRAALRVRASRRPPPVPASVAGPPDPLDQLTGKELCAVLDEEVQRLPEKYRAPLLLCCLEGLSRDEAAQHLRWSLGTVKGRLERGREILRKRLVRRGLTLPAALTGAVLVQQAPAAVPAPLAAATVRAARLFAAGEGAAPGVAAAPVVTLAEGVLKTMSLTRITAAAAVLLGLCVLVAGGGVGIRQALAAKQVPARQADRPAPAEPPRPPADERPRADRYGDPLPDGAVARLGTVRFRQEGWTQGALAFLADGKTLVSATDQGHALLFWEASTGRRLRTVSTAPLSIHSFALAPDRKRIAVGGFLPQEANGTIPAAVRVLDVSSGKELRTFPREDRDVYDSSLGFTPDGRLLLSLGNGVLRVEEVATGAELLRQQFPRDIQPELAVSPDGSTVAVAAGPNARKLYVWKWEAGEEPRQLPVGDFVARWVAFSPDGKLLAATSDREGTVRLWDVASGQLRHRLQLPGEHVSRTGEPTFTPDGKVLAVVGTVYTQHDQSESIHLWDPASGRYRRRLDPGGGRLAASPDSRLLAAGGPGGMRVWDLASEKPLLPEEEAHHGHIGRVAVSARGAVATASDDGTVRLWDLATGAPRSRLQHGHEYQMARAVAFAPDGRTLASSGLDDTVRLWDADTGREVYRLAGHGRLGGYRALGFTPDGRRLLSWGDDFYLRVWDVANGKAVREHLLRPTGVKVPGEDEDPKEQELMRMLNLGPGVFSPDGKRFVLALPKGSFVFGVDTGKELRAIETGLRNTDSLAVSPDGKLLLAGGWGEPVQTKLPDGRTRLSTVEEHPLGLWDLDSGKRVRQVLLPGPTSGPVVFSADGKTYATATEKKIWLWDTASGEERPGISGLPVQATALAFTPDGRQLVSALADTTALVWNLDEKH